MMKTSWKFLAIFILTGLALSSCQKDVLDEQQNVQNEPTVPTLKSASWYTVNLLIRTPAGAALNGVYCYIDDGTMCRSAITGANGLATFTLNSLAKVIFVADDNLNRGLYGCYSKTFINMPTVYNIVVSMPAKPLTAVSAGAMWDRFVTGINYRNSLSTLWSLYNDNRGYGPGIPGVFSISPLPTRDGQGRLGFKISGIWATEMAKWFPRVTGASYYYSL